MATEVFNQILPYAVDALVKRDDDATPACATENDYNGRVGVRVSSIFVIMLTSSFGALFPVLTRQSRIRVPEWVYFICKFFGSGVIVATAFIHLLDPAYDALSDDCLGGTWQLYPWAIAIAMFSIFVLFFLEIVTFRFANFDSFGAEASGVHTHAVAGPADHFGHQHDHIDTDSPATADASRLKDLHAASATVSNDSGKDYAHDVEKQSFAESLTAQVTAVFVLEFGIIFHSVFVGLTLAIAGEEFNTLYVVLVFHQGFEGLGLGTRLAATPWAPNKRWLPIVMAMGYGLTTPIAIAIGLGVRYSYTDQSRKALISNGIFDSISAGILIYTGLVELMAHEFLFSQEMARAPFKKVLTAFFIMCLGAGLMALLGRWA
ncbi:Zinc/iron permease [Lipomyces japonicus]|uniref:Zinc/iron permease n=1 Tax=Lipomyces japonicus TaxID=56871 RepID=UPI0034CD2AF8